jgi:hypothetical protein
VLLDNRFVFADFWKFQNGSLPEAEWQRSFAAANRAAHAAVGKQDTVTVLSIVLSRIYTRRNQVIHGGRAWGSRRVTECQAVHASAGILTCRLDRERSRTAQ